MPTWVFLALLFILPLRSAAESPGQDTAHYIDLSGSLGYHYSSGSYGDSRNTQISYVPLILRGDIDAWSLELTLPYMYIRGPRGILGVVEGDETDANDDIEHGSGPGDLLVAAEYTIWPWWEWMPFLVATGRIKFPTASEDDGLGTGEFDFYVGGQVVRTVGAFAPFIEIGYEALGDSSAVDLRDAVRVSGGLSYLVAEPVSVGLSLDYGSPTSSDAGHRIDIVPYIAWNVTPAATLSAYGSAGLASGSPDVGVGVQLGYRFYSSYR